MSAQQHILDTAEDLFNCQGYTAVGIDLIRDEAGVSKTTIYRHFKGKNALIAAVLQRRHRRFQDSLEQAVAAKRSTADKLTAIARWHFDWFDSATFKGCMFMHALAEFKGHNADISQIAIEHKQWLATLFLACLDSTTSSRELKAELLLTLLEGMIVRAEFSALSPQKQGYQTLMLDIAGVH